MDTSVTIGDDSIDRMTLLELLKKYDLALQIGKLSNQRSHHLEQAAAAWIRERSADIENPTKTAVGHAQRAEVNDILEAVRRIGIFNHTTRHTDTQSQLFACCWTYKIHIELPVLLEEVVSGTRKTLLQTPQSQWDSRRGEILQSLIRMKRLLESLNKEREFVEASARGLVLMWLDKIERDLFRPQFEEFLSHALRKPAGLLVPMDALRENFLRDAIAAAQAQAAGQDEDISTVA